MKKKKKDSLGGYNKVIWHNRGHVCLMNVVACVTTSRVRGESVKSVSSFSKVRTHYNQKIRRAPVMPNFYTHSFRFFLYQENIFWNNCHSLWLRPPGFCCGKSDLFFVAVALSLQIN